MERPMNKSGVFFSLSYASLRVAWRGARRKEGNELVTRFQKDIRCRPGWIVPLIFLLLIKIEGGAKEKEKEKEICGGGKKKEI